MRSQFSNVHLSRSTLLYAWSMEVRRQQRPRAGDAGSGIWLREHIHPMFDLVNYARRIRPHLGSSTR